MKREKPELRVELKRQEGELTLGGECVLRWEMSWPECEGAGRGAVAITRYYRRRSQEWKARWERELYIRACLDLAQRSAEGRPFRPWLARLDTRITLQKGDLLSLWQEGTEHWGYDRPLVLRTGDTWSVKEGVPRSLASVLEHRRGWKKRVLARVEAQAEARLAGGESLLDPDCLGRLRKEFDPERFWLSEQGAEIFYPMYLLAPGAEGVPVFTVGLSEV